MMHSRSLSLFPTLTLHVHAGENLVGSSRPVPVSVDSLLALRRLLTRERAAGDRWAYLTAPSGEYLDDRDLEDYVLRRAASH